uniref:Uncharacterized protein n=1 Tax=Timema bartmani TaxID=61472 RepID=A0A7R9HXR6_9NEOP|nr:unnamed protein product [Timema bartmani]
MTHAPAPQRRPSASRDGDAGTVDEYSPPPPPDGGWGWVVVFASFMIHIVRRVDSPEILRESIYTSQEN